MGTLAIPGPSKGQGPASIQLPEMTDAQYLTQVLQLPPGKTEKDVDDALADKANILGISIPRAPSPDKRNTASTVSASTSATYHQRTFSTTSNETSGTAITAQSTVSTPTNSEAPSTDANVRQRPKNLNFMQYDKYLAKLDPNLKQPKIQKPSAPRDTSSKSLFSVNTRKSLFSIKSTLTARMRWRRKPTQPFEPALSCVCCRDDFTKTSPLHNLPCSHTYCGKCLTVMVNQASVDESKMPPRCCTQPVPSPILKQVLDDDSQQSFLKAVVQFATPWESRIFCPNTDCGEFIPPRPKVDPKHPFSVTCRKCRTRVCVMCKRNAHPVGKDCPEDWELDAVLKMGEKSGWRRCYKCRNLVELSQGCTHMICRCKAQFCYICGGVWDPTVGCPNVCSGEEELERRRIEEEERLAELEVEKATQEATAAAEAAERAEAEKRSREDSGFQELQHSQSQEMQRFTEFASGCRDAMLVRHALEKQSLTDKLDDQEQKTRERNAKTASHLEDRQIAAEMELRATLDQSERSVRIRLKHMEAYCDGLGRHQNSMMPPRTVTERDLRELGQQYNLRDDMERLHQAKINVMRDRQAKRMEELLDRHTAEVQKLVEKRQEDLEDLATHFANEQDAMNEVLNSRRRKLSRRWNLTMEILCKEMSEKYGVRYAALPTPTWPEDMKEETAKAQEAKADGTSTPKADG